MRPGIAPRRILFASSWLPRGPLQSVAPSCPTPIPDSVVTRSSSLHIFWILLLFNPGWYCSCWYKILNLLFFFFFFSVQLIGYNPSGKRTLHQSFLDKPPFFPGFCWDGRLDPLVPSLFSPTKGCPATASESENSTGVIMYPLVLGVSLAFVGFCFCFRNLYSSAPGGKDFFEGRHRDLQVIYAAVGPVGRPELIPFLPHLLQCG